MKQIPDLFLGFNDAKEYADPVHKDLFSRFLLKDEAYTELTEQPNKYFLVGEKGTGKTAYAVFLSNHEHVINGKQTVGKWLKISDTDYLKFVKLKQDNNLILTDYVDVWKVIILLIVSEIVKNTEGSSVLSFGKFKRLTDIINNFYYYAFDPEREIHQAFEFVDNSEATANLLLDVVNFGLKEEDNVKYTFSSVKYQRNIMFIKKAFEDTLSLLKLNKQYMIFIDGIDIRPVSISYSEYKDCIKGLIEAAISLNSSFFRTNREQMGNIKVVLLLRPDILEKVGIHNLNNVLRDNTVLLDWRTTYYEHKNSKLFRLCDQMLKCQQPDDQANGPIGSYWNYYFPYSVTNYRNFRNPDTSFIPFLRFSYYRPRDIITLMKLMQRQFINEGKNTNHQFSYSLFENHTVMRDYSTYLIGEIHDQILFYYNEDDYKLFIDFFDYLKSCSPNLHKTLNFNYDSYYSAYTKMVADFEKNKVNPPPFFESADTLLQFIYDLNLVCHIENTYNRKTVFHWCFRERSYANISPKIRSRATYTIHYGAARALGIGLTRQYT